MSGVKVKDKKTGEWKEVTGFVKRPKWMQPCIIETLKNEDGKDCGTRLSVVLNFYSDAESADDDRIKIRMTNAMCKAIGGVLAEEGIINKDDIGF